MNNEIIIFHRPNIPPEKYGEAIKIYFRTDKVISVVKVQKSRFMAETGFQKDQDTIINVDLPKCDGIPKWRESISDISKYLIPYSIGDMKKMNSQIFTYTIRISEFIPLYYISRTLNLNDLSRYLEISIDSRKIPPIQIAHFYLDCKDKLKLISFPEITCRFELILEANPPFELYLTSLHFADLILHFQKQKQSRDFIRKWLHNVFNEFDKTKLYFNTMFQIVSNHQIISSNDAFIVWIYSQYFPSINGEKRFASILSNYEFTEEDLHIPLTENQAVWFFENRNKKENLSPNIVKLIVPYAFALYKSDPSKCFQLFQNLMISINSSPQIKDNLSLDQLINLLFLAAHPPSSGDVPFYQNSYDQISSEIHKKAELDTNNNEYIFENQKEILKLSWSQLFSTFNFCENDIFIEICYKWLKKNRRFNEDELNQFYSLFPFSGKEQYWKVRYSYILFRVFDILNQQYKFNLTSLIEPTQLFEGKGNSSIEKLFSYILEKNKIFIISPETLNAIHGKVNLNKKEQILLISILKYFQVKDFDQKILLPIFEESIDDVIALLISQNQNKKESNFNFKNNEVQEKVHDFENDFVLNTVLNSAKKYFGKIKNPTIILLSQLIPFNVFFEESEKEDFQPVELMNEDRVALYASLSREFDPHLINFPQLSFRLISNYLEAISFQFRSSKNSPISLLNKNFINSSSMINSMIDIKQEWMNISIPRFHFHEIGMITVCVMSTENQRTIELLERFFTFIGIQNLNIIFPSEDSISSIPEDNPVVIIKPFENSIECPLEKMIESFLLRSQPVAMDANSFFSLMNESPEIANLSGYLSFEADYMDDIEWSQPPASFLPFKENLPILKFESIEIGDGFADTDYLPNADIYFHSISCRLIKDISKKLTFANGRLFAAKIHRAFSIFNFDILIDGDEQNLLFWACLKQMSLTMLSLFYDFRLKYLDDSA